VPQLAPVPLRLPLTHTGAPEVQAMVPLKQGLVGVQVAPALQLAQVPPLSQTWLVPQVVPGALLPPSMQRSAPVLQSVTPFLQSPGLPPQMLPALQAMHAPLPLHTCPAPHDAPPMALVPESTHTALPLEQSVRPSRHGAPGFVVHGALATQAPQLPFASQTSEAPHEVPAGLLLPSTQVEVPVTQVVMPLRQPGLGLLVQATLAWQVTQLPPGLQTWLVPQTVPGARLPESTHACAPLVHEVTPVLHCGLGLALQAWPLAHATQLPEALQTRSGPQLVPGVRLVESTQRVLPVAQSMTPDLHGAPGLEPQVAPAVHAPQKPLASHTCPAPQEVPAAFGAPSTQACAPVVHEVTPSRQSEAGLVLHAPPAAQATHRPVTEHTWSMPQLVPGALRASSTHTGAPVAHSMTPRRHALPGLVVQAAPAVHAPQVPMSVQTWLRPHEAPAEPFMPSTHAGVAPQVVTPRRQGAPGFDAQAALGTHCRQLPPTQTRSAPHAVPEGAGGPSTHTALPDSQRTTPVTHGALGLVEQLEPSAQVMHWPALVQARPTPQGLPGARGRAESTHPAEAPQAVSPSLQGSGLVLHGALGTQVTHAPPRQMRSLPHPRPLGAAGPSMHAATPPWQSVTPVRQGAPVLPVHGWLS